MSQAWLVFPIVTGVALAQSALPDAGKLYEQRCAACHGDDASGSDRGPALSRSRRLRTRSTSEIHDIIQKGTPAGMPPFPLPEDQLQALAGFVRSMNATAFDAQPEGDTAAGEQFFFGKGQCAACHTAMGRGKSVGPDLTGIGRQLTLGGSDAQAHQPQRAGFGRLRRHYRPAAGRQHGARFRAQGDAAFPAISNSGWTAPAAGRTASTRLPGATKHRPCRRSKPRAEEQRNLLAFLSRLGGLPAGALPQSGEAVSRGAIERDPASRARRVADL